MPTLTTAKLAYLGLEGTGGRTRDDFSGPITVKYHSTSPTDRALRDLIVASSCEHIKELLENELLRELLRKTPDFAADVHFSHL